MPDPPPRLLGSYRTPVFGYGDTAFCEVRGECEIVGLSSAPIPWPIGRRGRHRFLILYSELVEAVKREAVSSVAYWWGVSGQTVTAWRKALGIAGTDNEGMVIRRREASGGHLERAREKARLTLSDPARAAKISQTLKGRSKPPEAARAVGKARLGSRHSEESRRRMRESQMARGGGNRKNPPWTQEEDDLVRSLPPSEAAARTGRSLKAVWSRRHKLRVNPAGV